MRVEYLICETVPFTHWRPVKRYPAACSTTWQSESEECDLSNDEMSNREVCDIVPHWMYEQGAATNRKYIIMTNFENLDIKYHEECLAKLRPTNKKIKFGKIGINMDHLIN